MRLLLHSLFWPAFFCFHCTTQCWANNDLFYDGDTFFPAQITQSAWKKAAASGPAGPFGFYLYNTAWDGLAMCGYRGAGRLRIEKLDKEFRRFIDWSFTLKSSVIYEDVLAPTPEKPFNRVDVVSKDRGSVLLFYPKGFDIERFGLLRPYNNDGRPAWANSPYAISVKNYQEKLQELEKQPATERNQLRIKMFRQLRERNRKLDEEFKHRRKLKAPPLIYQGDKETFKREGEINELAIITLPEISKYDVYLLDVSINEFDAGEELVGYLFGQKQLKLYRWNEEGAVELEHNGRKWAITGPLEY